MTIRVLLADDQALIRAGFKMIIDAEPGMQVVAEAADGREAVDLARSRRADVILMDIRMPVMDGLEATRRICADESLAGVRVLIVTTFEDDDNVVLALQAGASGFVGKNVAPIDLLAAIRLVATGEALLSPAATRGLIGRFLRSLHPQTTRTTETLDVLTEREREILILVAHGLSNEEIGARLFLSPLTAKTHINRAMTKLHARDRAQLVVLAYQSGLVSPGDVLPEG
ncbi:response regulator [Actinoplanes teichomyceticus]|uniref:LuxR family two component transcriptional regulator n=1 Tax=Actinoplanes teichomyceticus TaxID=1867 RepID=A0A561WAZ5_ACTTI|nr:response regulator transcription factor [Actinoplanes teichomyceticus]TWG21023.1 LuxR family two component transcriptional regulator [Actinoplanes teichomyceticus]GIF14843.1 DNA-binding response regulator [Actinoplanes teichomyceticus]